MRVFFFVISKRVDDFRLSIKNNITMKKSFDYSIIYLKFKIILDEKLTYLDGFNKFVSKLINSS